jgi:hypothetical protein
MPELIIISKNWSEQMWFSTGGTRAKKYLQAPDGKFYYFKRSQYKEATSTRLGKDFTFEFWNEIIAYELGSMLGFNMLRYDIAIDEENNIMGCISETMIDSEKEELIEGVKYLQVFSPKYDPTKKEHQHWYTFDLIQNALELSKFSHFMEDIIEIIVFDALIGNGDRHQENWAVIMEQELLIEQLTEIENKDYYKNSLKIAKWLIKNAKRFYKYGIEHTRKTNQPIPKSFYSFDYRFAPIYDSGSSLARELTNEKVNQYLSSEEDLIRYINKGVSEIHWEGKKCNHFELIEKINKAEHKEALQSILCDVQEKFNVEALTEIINKVDELVPDSYFRYKIPLNRKELMIKIITLRFKKLEQLIDEGI